jgi:hypothetical protein
MVDVSDTTESNDGTTKRATVRKLLKDKALPSGDIVGTSDVQTLGGKTLTSPVITDIDITGGSATDIDITGGSATDIDITGGSATDIDITGGSISESTNVVEVLKKVYPVGCIYTSTVSTNPNTLFGFGTWSEYGQGRVLVGLDAGDTSFDTLGETGGEKAHTLTIGEMPAHKHKFGYTGGNTDATGSPYSFGKAIGHDPSNTYSETTSTGRDGSHNNLQPYIVVYFWKREN